MFAKLPCNVVYSVCHSLPNPAGWRSAAPCRNNWAHYRHTLQTHSSSFLHTTNIPLFKFRCNIFIGVRIIKEMPGSVGSGTNCTCTLDVSVTFSVIFSIDDDWMNEYSSLVIWYWWGKFNIDKKTVPLSLSPPQNPTWTGLVLNLDLFGDWLANTFSNHGTIRIWLPFLILNCEKAMGVSFNISGTVGLI
jgi:hypothetical protein